MEKTEAILIDRKPWRESSLIVHWCAPEAGIFKTMAKGALRPKSPFAGRLDLFVSAEVRFVRGRSGDLHTLAEAQWTHPRLGIRESYDRVLAATYFVKLIAQVVERETPIPDAFDLLAKALDYLATHDPSPELVTRFENRLADELGIAGEHERHGAPLIEAAFHHRLPVQREQLMRRLASRG